MGWAERARQRSADMEELVDTQRVRELAARITDETQFQRILDDVEPQSVRDEVEAKIRPWLSYEQRARARESNDEAGDSPSKDSVE